MRMQSIPTLIAVTLLCGCSGISVQQSDGPPKKSVDIDSIPDAQPRFETLSKTGNPDSYVVFGKRYYVLESSQNYSERGIASWYGTKFHGKKTSSGEPYDMYAMTAAHKTLPIPCFVKVTNLDNGNSIVVRVNDRGPFVDNRIIDLSYVAARKIDMTTKGTANVEIRVIHPNQLDSENTNQAPIEEGITPQAPKLYVQIGAFSRRNNAENLVIKLQQDVQLAAVLNQLKQKSDQQDIEPYFHVLTSHLKKSQGGSGKTNTNDLFRVRLGPFGNRQITEEMGTILRQQGYADHFIQID